MNGACTELVLLLDMSGSMYPLAEDTVGGLNALLARQKKLPGEALVSVFLFNYGTELPIDRVPLKELKGLRAKDYVPGGSTLLLDAIGKAIVHIATIHRYIRPEDVPAHTVFVILTDGAENSSFQFTSADIREMIAEKREKCGWEFLYLGANVNAAATAESLGIDPACAADTRSDPDGTALAFAAAGFAIETVCQGKSAAGSEWKVPLCASSCPDGIDS